MYAQKGRGKDQVQEMEWRNLQCGSSFENDEDYLLSRRPYNKATDSISFGGTQLSEISVFRYRPLNPAIREFRVLDLRGPCTLLDGRFTYGTIRHLSLNDNPTFIALSYVWGTQSLKRPILIDGHIFHVTENLAKALERFQHADWILPIWIDAICINQEDDVEKSSQVQEMGNIYRTAQFVLGWLGPEANDSSTAITSFVYIAQEILEMPDGPCQRERYELFSKILPSGTQNEDLAFPTAAVVSLMNRPWWQRIWVVQEVVLAKKVYIVCGNMDTAFDMFMLAFTAMYELPVINAVFHDALSKHLQPLHPLYRSCDPRLLQAAIHGQNQEPQPLERRMLDVNGMKATDPRDHILSLLGMVSDAAELGIRADYTKSCLAIYTEVAMGLLKRQGHLQVLTKSKFPKQQRGLPSWVPDWSLKTGPTIWDARESLFSTGRSSSPLAIKFGEGTLTITGAKFGTIKKVGRSWDNSDLSYNSRVLRNILWEFKDFTRANCNAYKTEQDIEAATWRTPIIDIEPSVFSETRRYNRRATKVMQDAFLDIQGTPRAPENRQASILPSSFPYITMMHALHDRRIFATDSGFLGLGPQHLQPNDLVCVLLGAEVPFILRELQQDAVTSFPWRFWRNSSRCYELVGECYIHGIMDGEFLKKNPPLKDFTLR